MIFLLPTANIMILIIKIEVSPMPGCLKMYMPCTMAGSFRSRLFEISFTFGENEIFLKTWFLHRSEIQKEFNCLKICLILIVQGVSYLIQTSVFLQL